MGDTAATAAEHIECLLATAAGGAAPELAHELACQLTAALGLSAAPADAGADAVKVAAALQAVAVAAPRDGLEAMLATQMAAVHAAALRALERATGRGDQPQIEALYLRQAARLMHLFARQAEALERRHAAADRRAEERALEAELLASKQRAENELALVERRRPEKLKPRAAAVEAAARPWQRLVDMAAFDPREDGWQNTGGADIRARGPSAAPAAREGSELPAETARLPPHSRGRLRR